jgi:hypothetical protein
MKRNAVVCVGAEEERLRRPRSVYGFIDIVPQCENTLLWKMPSHLIQLDVELKCRPFIKAWATRSVAEIVHAWIGERRPGFRRKAVGDEIGRGAVRLKARMLALGMKVHRRHFHRRAVFRKSHRIGGEKLFAEIQSRLDAVGRPV